MNNHLDCRCTGQPISCNESRPATVPLSVANPPLRDTISLRIGEHPDFFRSLIRRLSSGKYKQLNQLKTRNLSDPSIALLDSWSILCDVLTFYNQQYFQEAYLRTAKETRSLQELSKLIGYRPGPGVASSTYVAFTLEGMPGKESVESMIPKGTQLQSVPSSDELPQIFETTHDLIARPEWNAIKPRQKKPQHITEENIEQIDSIVIKGTTPRLVANDLVLFDFGPGSKKRLRYVKASEPNEDFASTTVYFNPSPLSARKLIEDVIREKATLKDNLNGDNNTDSTILGLFINYLTTNLNELNPERGLLQIDLDLRQNIKTWLNIDDTHTHLDTFTTLHNSIAKETIEFLDGVIKACSEWESETIEVEKLIEPLASAWLDTTNGFPNNQTVNNRNQLNENLRKIDLKLDKPKQLRDLLTSDLERIDLGLNSNEIKKLYLKAWADVSDLSLNVIKSKSKEKNKFKQSLFFDGLKSSIDELKKIKQEDFDRVKKISTHFSPKAFLTLINNEGGTFSCYVADLDETIEAESSLPGLKSLINSFLSHYGDWKAAATKSIKFLVSIYKEAANGAGKNVFLESLKNYVTASFKDDLNSLDGTFLRCQSAKDNFERIGIFAKGVQLLLVKQHHEVLLRIKEIHANRKRLSTAGKPINNKELELFKSLIGEIVGLDPETDPLIVIFKKIESFVTAIKGLPVNEPIGYEIHKSSLLRELSDLQKSVGQFVLDSEPSNTPEGRINYAGLFDALKEIIHSGDGTDIDATRRISDIINGHSEPTDIPDLLRQLATSQSPDLRDQLIAVWREIRSSNRNPTVFALKTVIPLFGFNAAKKQKVEKQLVESIERSWDEFIIKAPNNNNNNDGWQLGSEVYLSQPVEGVTTGSAVVFRRSPEPDQVCTVDSALSPVQPGVLDIAAAGSFLKLTDDRRWHNVPDDQNKNIFLLRQTSALLPSHELALVDIPIIDPVGSGARDALDNVIELNGLYPELDAGRTIVISGERQSPKGVMAQEAARIRYVTHSLSDMPNDSVHTHIQLDRPIRNAYRRANVQIFANVVKATHGKSVTAILGHGDASKRFQKIPLTEAPLTYLPAPNASGVESTLELRVNQIEWHETGSLLDSKSASRDYIIHHHGNGHQAVQFGDGKTGARLPTGNSNVVAKYRVGLGSAGNVKPNSISQLLSRPFGVKEVTNPLPATGGADPDGIDQIRANAPIAVMALDRIVSVKDHADFARNFAGIDKAVAKAIQVGGQSFVGVTIAGSGDIPISRDSDLMINLRDAFRKLGDPCQPVITEERELLRLFLNAEIKLHPDHAWQFVQPKIEQQLYDVFSFARRQLGQDLYLSEVYNTIHSVAGVAYVNVTLFTTISQSSLNSPNVLQKLENGIKEQRLVAHGGHVESDLFKPAQLIYLSRKIPDSLILSEVR